MSIDESSKAAAACPSGKWRCDFCPIEFSTYDEASSAHEEHGCTERPKYYIISSKRRRLDRVLHITDLPNAILVEVASYLTKPSRALFAMAVTAPTASWKNSGWSRKPSVVGDAILSSTQWESLDFGDIVKGLYSYAELTDDHVFGILMCINAVNTLKTLKLTGCSNISGKCLDPLRGSTVLRQIDLVVKSEASTILSESAVLPILNSIINTHGCSLKYIELPVQWREGRSPELEQFLERYHELMENRRLRCFKCNTIVRSGADDRLWYSTNHQCYGLQMWTCYNCLNHFCEEHEGEDTCWTRCKVCSKDYCSSCDEMMKDCDKCGDGICKGCWELSKCNGCKEHTCNRCLHACTCCNQMRCSDCLQMRECVGSGCQQGGFTTPRGKKHCLECFDGKDRDVEKCDDCSKDLCRNCRYLNCHENWDDACRGCKNVVAQSFRKNRALMGLLN